VPPPTEHAPVRHDFADVNCSPLHVPAPHVVPSVALLHAAVLVPGVHTLHASPGFGWPDAQHAPPIRHWPDWITLVHPAPASQASFVHAFPSSHPVVAPPTVQSPDEQVFAAIQVSPAHVLARHWTPSPRLLHVAVAFDTVHAWHALPGFNWLSA
jgi:hypothetical protein